MAGRNPKIKDGDEQAAEAKKWYAGERLFRALHQYISFCLCSLKTSLFKWSPDYEGAAYAYNKAGMQPACSYVRLCVCVALYRYLCVLCV